ncbi:MAG: tetratricopeptide repeat protein [Aquificaceae bacterium]
MRDVILRVGFLVLISLSLVGGFLLWDRYRKNKLEKLAYKEYEISKLIQAGNYQKVKELIETTYPKAGPFKPLILSYELYMDEKVQEDKVIREILEGLKDKDLRSFYIERYAYYLFKQGKAEEALRELEKIGEEDFNHASALLLKAQVLRKAGKEEEAKDILKRIKEKAPDTYFANIALALLGE